MATTHLNKTETHRCAEGLYFLDFDKECKASDKLRLKQHHLTSKSIINNFDGMIAVNKILVTLQRTLEKKTYCKIASSNMSHLEAHAGLSKLLMKGIFGPYVL